MKKKRNSLCIIMMIMLLLITTLSGCGNEAGGNLYDKNDIYTENAGSSSDSFFDGDYDSKEETPKDNENSTEESSEEYIKRKIVYTVITELQTKDFDAAMDTLQKGIQDNGGYIQSQKQTDDGGINSKYSRRTLTMVVRVPSKNLEAFLSGLKNDNMHTLSLSKDSKDLTTAYYDKEIRVESLKLQEERLLEMLSKATDLQTMLELEDRLADVRYEIETFTKELSKLERINPQAPDYSVQLTYLQTMLSLPWGIYTEDNLNISNAEKTLNKDHYGLEKVKERILEHLAVLKLKNDMKSPIVCLYGPPGVGKTSLGRSIAAALKRKYVRMSLGGVHDEAEIRGHRKTYIGAMPGRIVKSLIKAEASNPVIILDEIDKLGSDHRGDPSSAMLEVLDPEQNHSFHDNYLDVDYDLSKVMFIATANNLGTIPPALLDRMELIEVSGYITEEKVEIAKRHLVPKELENNGLKKEYVKISKPALEYIIENYTRESGVRELEKKINKVMRKIALKSARDGYQLLHDIKPADVRDYLGAPEYSRDKYQGNEYAGVVTGLAWTAVGGEILFVETSLSKGKGGRLTLTGNLGDVMKESAMLALEYLKAHTCLLDVSEEIFENWNIHVHVPEGAIPKDGPSAGITMVTSLASALTQRKVKPNLAMTGEITLRGKVLPVGGIKEKILAAKRAGIKEIILCEENRKNIEEIQPVYLKGLTFHYVNDIKEVLELALTNEKVNGAIDFCAVTNKKEEEKK